MGKTLIKTITAIITLVLGLSVVTAAGADTFLLWVSPVQVKDAEVVMLDPQRDVLLLADAEGVFSEIEFEVGNIGDIPFPQIDGEIPSKYKFGDEGNLLLYDSAPYGIDTAEREYIKIRLKGFADAVRQIALTETVDGQIGVAESIQTLEPGMKLVMDQLFYLPYPSEGCSWLFVSVDESGSATLNMGEAQRFMTDDNQFKLEADYGKEIAIQSADGSGEVLVTKLTYDMVMEELRMD